MKFKTLIIVTGVVVALILLTGTFSAGFVAGRVVVSADANPLIFFPGIIGISEQTDASNVEPRAGTPQELIELFQPFWQTWDIVGADYVEQPVDEEAMMQGAISGMLESLGDQHTSYLDPDMFERANAQLEGEEYEGIGAWVDITGDYLTIISPMPGSPAEKAGLQPNDKVIAVDGEDMTGIDGELVRQRVIGPKDTKVLLTIQREGVEEPFDVEVERASIVVPSVDYRMLDEDIAYIQLYTFGDKTGRDLRAVLKELLAQEPVGLILDLRYNGGGFLNTAIEVVSEFIGDGVVMYEEYGDGSRDTYNAKRGGRATEIPLVVLINEGSASASEIVAGAIQDRERGFLVGATSFGKGSVQNYTSLINDQGAVRITIARWLTPNGRQIMVIGLEPDYVVEFTEEDFENDIDPQLDKAIELLIKNSQ
jgi:carboxyl-terminal processing protease